MKSIFLATCTFLVCSMDKPFWLFAGQDYESSGGFDEFQSAHETLELAREAVGRLTAEGKVPAGDSWWHIIDIRVPDYVDDGELK